MPIDALTQGIRPVLSHFFEQTQAKKADVEKAFKLGRLIVMGADKTYLPVALLAAGVVVTDGTTAVTCTAADADPA